MRRLIALAPALVLALGGVAVTALPAQAVGGVVTNLDDTGTGSLRAAVIAANADPSLDTITFQPGLTGTIPLTTGLLITEALVIDGSGADITVSRVNGSSFDLVVAQFPATGPKSLALTGFEISNDALAPVDVGRGLVVSNGAGAVNGPVTLTDMTFFGHYNTFSPTPKRGAAILISDSTNVTITRGSISSNLVDSDYDGAGLFVDGYDAGRLTITGTTFANNVASSGGSGLSAGGAVVAFGLDGVSITDATFRGNNSSEFGGAVYVDQVGADGVLIANTRFLENVATADDGGAVLVQNVAGPFTVRGSTFSDNHADAGGGGALFGFDTGDVTIDDSTFTVNTAETGGGVYLDDIDGTLALTRATFEGNEADADGGGVFLGLLDGATTIAGSVFRTNTVAESGGGLYVVNFDVASTITDTQFLSNEANESGGGVFIDTLEADLAITRSTFGANDAEAAVGGFTGGVGLSIADLDAAAELTIDSSTFANNSPVTPGVQATSLAIDSSAGQVTLRNSTFSEPSAAAPALFFFTNPSTAGLTVANSTIVSGDAGVSIRDMSTSDFEVQNSIVVGAAAAGSVVVDASQAGEVLLSWSILSSALPASTVDVAGNQLSTDPDLGPLATNGGSTQTRLPLAGSSAINAGNPAFVAPPSVDQRGTGFARVQGGRIDIGAVEVQPVAPATGQPAPPATSQPALLPATGQIVSWWLLPVAGGILLLGIAAFVIARRRRPRGAHARVDD